jgi:hypothetical protein
MAVRFILVPVAVPSDEDATPARPAILDALDRQLDLRRVELGDESLVAYENTTWLPVRAVASGPTAQASAQAGPEALIRADLSHAHAALPGPLPTAGSGPVDGESVLLAEAVDAHWQLQVDGKTQPRRTAFGWATAWDVASPGAGALKYKTPATRYALVGIQVFLWVLALFLIRTWRHGPPLSRWRARRRVATRPATTVIDLGAPAVTAPPAVVGPAGLGAGATVRSDWVGEANS